MCFLTPRLRQREIASLPPSISLGSAAWSCWAVRPIPGWSRSGWSSSNRSNNSLMTSSHPTEVSSIVPSSMCAVLLSDVIAALPRPPKLPRICSLRFRCWTHILREEVRISLATCFPWLIFVGSTCWSIHFDWRCPWFSASASVPFFSGSRLALRCPRFSPLGRDWNFAHGPVKRKRNSSKASRSSRAQPHRRYLAVESRTLSCKSNAVSLNLRLHHLEHLLVSLTQDWFLYRLRFLLLHLDHPPCRTHQVIW